MTTSLPSGEWTEALDSFFLETVHAILMDALPDPEKPQEFDGLLFETRPAQAKAPVQPMSDLAKELATRIKETFYAYSNRKTSDNRSAQTTLGPSRSEEHTSELQSLMRISYAVFCLKKQKTTNTNDKSC